MPAGLVEYRCGGSQIWLKASEQFVTGLPEFAVSF